MNAYWDNNLSIYLPNNSDDKKIQQAFIEKLAQWGVRYIIIYKDLLRSGGNNSAVGEEWSWLDSFCKSNYYLRDNFLVYEIPKKVMKSKYVFRE